MTRTEFTELIPELPEDIALECLTRLQHTTHSVASHVCHRWRCLIRSREFYYHRKESGFTRKAAVLVQSLPLQPEHSLGSEPKSDKKQPKYGLSLFDPVGLSWEQIDPVPKFPDGLPLFCRVASTEGKLVLLGGWDPVSWEPLREVFVYEFTSRRWTRCADMPSKRSFFAVGAYRGKIFVAGGHDDNKNALKTAWGYDLDKDEWTELAQMSEERDECEGIRVGSEFWVVSGYDTESQGVFKTSADVLEIETGNWRHVEDAWKFSQCPRGRVGTARNGEFKCWGEADPESDIQVGSCGVDLGERVVVTGSGYQGGPQGLYMVEKGERKTRGLNCKMVKMEVPDEFNGFVQSGCCVEI